ncbi:MAG TPA: S8 family serine peptidase [Bacteroidales bacterium]|nr:S8 family serine peptidase [Bacteroidales bacterium]HNR41701.1 S8 family serine peptidase [Bacteroidales bacterium]HPM19094.1 S8 family serine peptidase [Bacteroidales bacterium]
MYTYTLGGKSGKKYVLHESTDMVALRTRSSRSIKNAVSSPGGRKALKDFELVLEFPEADISVYRLREPIKDPVAVRDRARMMLKKEPELRFAGKVLVEADGRTLVLYTENIFIKFHDEVRSEICEKILKDNKLRIKQKPDYSKNTYFAGAPENTGLRIFSIAESLLAMEEVELCHPELIRKRGFKGINPKQWHLAGTLINGRRINAGVKADLAHSFSTGKNIVIAVIDDGVEIDHPEFRLPGKVVHSRDVVTGSNDPRPRSSYNNHGTACAGVAAASGMEASGVAPGAMLMPVRLSANLGSAAEAAAFKWAADHGADIISCSWGPEDGSWSDPDDPVHTTMVDLPDSTRLAIDYAVSHGRNGKGCIITFAAGNGNEDCGYDGYAGYEKVMAVAACNDRSRRSIYSDYGKNIWCCFPSNDFGYPPFNHPDPLTPGIFTTDRLGRAGYNPGGNYTDSFGGTSASCPGVAGTAALVLSANPALKWTQVRKIIRETCDKIDISGGEYDSEGHSRFYGYGRINALKAVKLALETGAAGKSGKRRKKSVTVNQ